MTYSQQHAPLVRGGAKPVPRVVTDGRLHDTHAPGCIISGVLLVNRVPGNFHIEVRVLATVPLYCIAIYIFIRLVVVLPCI
jgi:hypothetical protein